MLGCSGWTSWGSTQEKDPMSGTPCTGPLRLPHYPPPISELSGGKRSREGQAAAHHCLHEQQHTLLCPPLPSTSAALRDNWPPPPPPPQKMIGLLLLESPIMISKVYFQCGVSCTASRPKVCQWMMYLDINGCSWNLRNLGWNPVNIFLGLFAWT